MSVLVVEIDDKGTLDRVLRGLRDIGVQAKRTEGSFQGIGRNLSDIGGQVTRNLGLPISLLGGFAIKMASDFESSFAGVRKTVNATEEEFARLADGMRELAKITPTNVNELNRIGEAAGQLGIKTENILRFTDVIARLGVTTNLSTEQAATSLARFANITGLSQGQFDRLGSSIVALGNNFATTEAELVDFGLRMAGAGKIAGLTEAQILAIGTAMSSVGVEAEAGGTAVQQVLIEMTKAVAEGNKNLQLFAKTVGLSAADFSSLFKKDAGEAFTQFVEGLGEQGDRAFQTLEGLGLQGQRLTRSFISLAGAGDLLSNAMGVATRGFAENSALAKEAEERYKTFESQLKITWNQVKDVAIAFGTELLPVLRDTLGATKPLIDMLGVLASLFGRLPGFVKMSAVAIAGIGIAAGPALSFGGSLLKLFGSLNKISPTLAANLRLVASGFVAISTAIAALIGIGLNMLIDAWREQSEAAIDAIKAGNDFGLMIRNLQLLKINGTVLSPEMYAAASAEYVRLTARAKEYQDVIDRISKGGVQGDQVVFLETARKELEKVQGQTEQLVKAIDGLRRAADSASGDGSSGLSGLSAKQQQLLDDTRQLTASLRAEVGAMRLGADAFELAKARTEALSKVKAAEEEVSASLVEQIAREIIAQKALNEQLEVATRFYELLKQNRPGQGVTGLPLIDVLGPFRESADENLRTWINIDNVIKDVAVDVGAATLQLDTAAQRENERLSLLRIINPAYEENLELIGRTNAALDLGIISDREKVQLLEFINQNYRAANQYLNQLLTPTQRWTRELAAARRMLSPEQFQEFEASFTATGERISTIWKQAFMDIFQTIATQGKITATQLLSTFGAAIGAIYGGQTGAQIGGQIGSLLGGLFQGKQGPKQTGLGSVAGLAIGDTANQLVDAFDQLRSAILEIEQITGASLDALNTIAVQTLDNGRAVAMVAGHVVGTFGSIQDALQAAVNWVLDFADLSGATADQIAILQNAPSLDAALDLLRTMDEIAQHDLSPIERQLISLKREFQDFARRLEEVGASTEAAVQRYVNSLWDIRNQLTGTSLSEAERLARDVEAYNQAVAQAGEEAARLEQALLQQLQDLVSAGLGARLAEFVAQFVAGSLSGAEAIVQAQAAMAGLLGASSERLAGLAQAALDEFVRIINGILGAQAELSKLPPPIGPGEARGGGTGRRQERESLTEELQGIVDSAVEGVSAIIATIRQMEDLRERIAKLGPDAALAAEALGILQQQVSQQAQEAFLTLAERMATLIGDEGTLQALQEIRYDVERAQMLLQIQALELLGVLTQEQIDKLHDLFGRLPEDLPIVEAFSSIEGALDALGIGSIETVKSFQNLLDALTYLAENADDLALGAGQEFLDQLAELGKQLFVDFGDQLLGFLERYYGNVEGFEMFRANLERARFELEIASLRLQFELLKQTGLLAAEIIDQIGDVFDWIDQHPIDWDQFVAPAMDFSGLGGLDSAAEDAARAIEDLARRFAEAKDSIRDFLDQMAGGQLGVVAPEAAYNAVRQRFEDTLRLAQGGDIGALESITGISREYIDILKSFSPALLNLEFPRIQQALQGLLGLTGAHEENVFVDERFQQRHVEQVQVLRTGFDGLYNVGQNQSHTQDKMLRELSDIRARLDEIATQSALQISQGIGEKRIAAKR